MRFLPIISVALLLINSSAIAKELTASELEKWFNSDELHPPTIQTAEVNEGELVFLSQIPVTDVHHHQNKLIIDAFTSQRLCSRACNMHMLASYRPFRPLARIPISPARPGRALADDRMQLSV